ncbi:MAG: carboxypeptidase regulatory-like domain-containing protein, partial [Acidobacteriaceae bacterium]|nr:carboxypeptidase regulatory-like domain-containing protein [Acidobacteriaceae bacterium]
MTLRPLVIASLLFASVVCTLAASAPPTGRLTDTQENPVSGTTSQPQLSGTVVDTSGALISGAAVLLRSANGAVQLKTESDTNGSYSIPRLPPGKYLLVVSHPGFETKEIPITLESNEPPAPLGITLAVSSVSTTINVQGREDDLIGIASSATQGTVGAKEIE